MKPVTIVKQVAPEVVETNITKTFRPKNYSVPMDFSGDEVLYVFKRPTKSTVDEKLPEFLVCMYNVNTGNLREFSNFKNNIKLLRFFKNGFVYVRDNKAVLYYDTVTGVDQFLFSHSFTIIALAVFDFRIATIDKEGYINLFNFSEISFYYNEINIMQIKELPKDLVGARLFEMDYPYFSSLNEQFFVFTSDHGTLMIDYSTPKVQNS